MTAALAPLTRLSTDIAGLDAILHGGLLSGRAYLARGGPGTGKTTLGAQFLAAGATRGETSLLVTLGEPGDRIRQNAARIGFDLEGIHLLDLSPSPDFFSEAQSYDIFAAAEVELNPITQKIVDEVERLNPQRVFVDSMTQFRYLAADTFQFRKQVLSFLRYLLDRGATVLFTSESSPEAPDSDLQFMSDGVIDLKLTPDKRTIRITKFRGSDFQDGVHSMRLGAQGMEVFPQLVPRAYKREFVPEPISSGIPMLDELTHGGIERGTVTMLSGPSGVGKTTLGLQFMKEAAGRGERSVVYTFEEEVEIILKRAESISIPARIMIDRGILSVTKVEPLQYTPDEFASMARREVEELGAQIVMLDSVTGFNLTMQDEDFASRLHALCKYLSNMGVTVIVINQVNDLSGTFQDTGTNITYLADNLISLQYVERLINGKVELRKAIGVVKKRLSDFEKTLRELEITRYGLKVSQPIEGLQGILGGSLPVDEE